jgi:Fic family protein
MYAPKYQITNKILKNIGEIEAAKEVIENAPLVPAFEKQFRSDAVAKTVHHGTHIEGNDLTLYQTKKILEGEHIVAKARDIQEVINYRRAVDLLDEFISKRGGYDPEILTEIHRVTVEKLVPPEKVGVFRTSQVVVKDEGTGEVIFQPPPFIEVPYLIEDFFAWLNDPEAQEIHPVIRAGIAHYILVAIHPFVEGNGRTARAFAALILLKEGYDIKRFFAIEEHFDQDPASYYEAFSKVDKQAKNIGQRDLTIWLEYFTKSVSVELAKIKDKIKKLSMDTRLKIKIGKQVALTERQMKLVEFISSKGDAVMQDLKGVLTMVSEDTILRDVRDLMEKGIIRKEGSTKASRYIMNSK